tara:strand:+ start:598 stop:783 length:186 start_codon:yes stop_codon:yes gene_type:complete
MTMKERMQSEELLLDKNLADALIHVMSQNVTTRSRLLNLGHTEEAIAKFMQEGIYVEVGNE